MGYWTFLGFEVSGRMVVLALFLGLFFMGANWRLFQKCNQPAWAAFVPGYNVVVAMRVLGRPDWHAALFLLPIFNIYLAFKTISELARSFGKKTTLDTVLAIVFNVLYVLNLALSEDEEYQGPAYEGQLVDSNASENWAHA